MLDNAALKDLLAKNCSRPAASLLLLDHPKDLFLGEAALPHSSAPSLGQTLLQIEGASGGQVMGQIQNRFKAPKKVENQCHVTGHLFAVIES